MIIYAYSSRSMLGWRKSYDRSNNMDYRPHDVLPGFFHLLYQLLRRCCPKPVINKPPPLSRDDNRDPNIKDLKRRGFINCGFTLVKAAVMPEPTASSISIKELQMTTC